MANKFLTDIELDAGLKDNSNGLGTSGQVLSSTGTGVSWIDSTSDVAERIEVTVKNVSGAQLAKGTVVHAAPTATPPSGNVIEVIAADYDTASAMPAIGVLNETINNEAEGAAVMMGAVSGIDTDSFNIGDELYVGNNGTFTSSKPTATNQLIQKMAVVIKKHASNGLIKVFGAGRSNDVPNLVDRDFVVNAPFYINEYLYHYNDVDTYIRFLDDRIDLRAGNLSFIDLREGASPIGYFNVSNNDIDLQVRGTTNNNLIRTNAGTDRVGIGGSPNYLLDVHLGTTNSMRLVSTDDTAQIIMSDDDTTAYIGVRNSTMYMSFTGGTQTDGFYIDSSGNGTFAGNISLDNTKYIYWDNNNSVGISYVKSGGNLNLIIDSNNNTSNAYFVIEKDTQTAGSGTELFKIEENANATFAGDITLTGGGTIQTNVSTGGEDIDIKAAGEVRITIDSNQNSGDDQYFKVMKHVGSELFTVKETGTATFSGHINMGGQVGTWIESNAFSDSVGWNSSHGVYIGSNVGSSSTYVYGNGKFYDGTQHQTIFHDGYHPNADKWTTARTLTVNLSGQADGSGSVSWDGSGNAVLNITNMTVDDDALDDNYVTIDTTQTITGAKTFTAGSVSLRNNAAGDGTVIGDLKFETTAAEGTDDRIGIIRLRNQNGGSTTRGGKMSLYTRAANSSAFNETRFESDGQWYFPANVHIPSGRLEITNSTTSPLLNLHNTSNGSGASIQFSDQTDESQKGYITFYHADGSSQGGGASFHFTSNQGSDAPILVVGDTTNSSRIVVKSAENTAEVDYGFVDDQNTGMYRSGADAVGLVAGGSRKLNVNSGGVTVNNGHLFIPQYMYHDGDTNTRFEFQSDQIFLRTGGTDRLLLNNNEARFQGPVTGPNIGRNNDDEILFAITEQDTSASIRRKFGNEALSALTKVDDSTAPADGCFQLTDTFYNITIPEYFKVDDDMEFTFEVWVKFVSGTDTDQRLYAGASFYDSSKTYLGNTQRYWGESGEQIDANTKSDGNWYHFSGTLGPSRGTSAGNFPTSAEWMKLILLLNYSSNANTVRYCGLKFYKSGGKNNKMFTSIYRKAIGSEAASSHSTWLGRTVMDTSGNLYTPEKLIHADDTDTYIRFATNEHSFYAGGTERMAITGDVHVQGTTDLNINGTSRRLNFTAGTGTVRTTTANDLILATNSAERFKLYAAGNARFTNQQNGSSRIELYNNRQDASNVGVYGLHAYNSVEVANINFYRGGGGDTGYTKIQANQIIV